MDGVIIIADLETPPAEFAKRYRGKFDAGWDAYRERVFARQKQLGWIPANTQLTPRNNTIPSRGIIPEAKSPFFG